MPLQLIPHLHRAVHRVGLYVEQCPGVTVTQAEAHILAHLASEGDSTVAQLHRALAHRRSTLTSILNRLEDRGFIVRESVRADRRTFLIRLTKPGQAAATRVYEHLEALETAVLEQLKAAQAKAFAVVVNGVEETAERLTVENTESESNPR